MHRGPENFDSSKKSNIKVSATSTPTTVFSIFFPTVLRGTRQKLVARTVNHEIVRAVLTERQTSDCDIKCRITFSFQWKFHVYGPQYRVENKYDDFVKVMLRKYSVFSSI